MIYSFTFYNAFPDRSVYCLYGSSITNQTYSTSIISYTQYVSFSYESTSSSLYFTIFNHNGDRINVTSNAITGITSTTGNMIGLIPSMNTSLEDVITTLGDESNACLIYQNMALNMNAVSIYNGRSSSPISMISSNQAKYSVCSPSSITYLPPYVRFCSVSDKFCVSSGNNVS
jgi:hypothetical protein